MERLRDLVDVDEPAVLTLAEMVQAVGDLEPRPGAEDRVLQAMARRTQSWPTWWLRAVVVLLIVIAVPAAIAGVNKVRQARPHAAVHAVDHRGPVAAPDLGHQAPGSPMVQVRPLPLPEAPGVPAVRALPAPTAQIERSPARHNGSRAAHDEPSPMSGPTRPPTQAPGQLPAASQQLTTGAPPDESPDLALIRSDEAALVLGAMRALRRDHDTQAAIRQLATYRRRFPSGDLAEEALALSIEAFVALDDREALALADEYLRRFPQGRFHDLAERTQRRSQDPDDTPKHAGSVRKPAAPRIQPAP